MKFKFTILFFLTLKIFGQFNPKIDEYKHYSIIKKKDTINFHLYSNEKVEKLNSILLFLQGSGYIKSHIPFDLDKIPKNFAFVVISKKGIPFSIKNTEFKTPKSFYENESLEYRAKQADEVIKYIKKNLIHNPIKVIAIGHSEGSDVVAKLGTINKSLTHIGFWAGGGNTQYYDFALFTRKEVQKGNLTELQGKMKIDSLLNQFKEIQKEENSITKFWEGHSFRRWSKFSEPSIENLLKIKIPIFATACGKDESVPIESSYLIPIEFIRNNKKKCLLQYLLNVFIYIKKKIFFLFINIYFYHKSSFNEP